MRIVIDIDESGAEHWIETDPGKYPKVGHPDGRTEPVDAIDMLKHHNDHPAAREVGGWHVVNQLPGEPEPITRWQRFVNAINALPDEHELKQHGFK